MERKKVKRLYQTQYACPAKFLMLLDDGEEIEVRHRIISHKPDYWSVYVLGENKYKIDVETLEGDALTAIKEVLSKEYDFSEAEIILKEDPNEDYEWDEGWGTNFIS